MLSIFRQMARETRACGSAPQWEERLFGAYREMDELCRRHGIRFVVYKAPLLQEFERNLPAETQNQIAVYEQRLRDMHIEYVKPQIELDERHSLYEVAVPDEWIGKSIIQLDVRRRHNLTIIGIKQDDVMNFMIKPDTVLTKDMTLLVLGEYKALQKCFRF